MKANELMIGDWIRYDGMEFIVRIIDSLAKTLTVEYMGKSPFFQNGVIDETKAEPIPLTEEILKANGFGFTDLNSVGLRYQYYGVKSLQVVVEKEEEEDSFGHYQRKIVTLDNECIYVHELQHALRICGLNDLADNFKVI